MDKKFVFSIIVLLIIVAAGILVWQLWYSPVAPPTPSVCTQEAKLCPDGSSVSRIGPNCEFTACPGSPESSEEQNNNSILPRQQTTALKCSDGTLYEKCSSQKPKYCQDGSLVDKASICGCAVSLTVSGDSCQASRPASDVIILKEENSGEILIPPSKNGTQWWSIDTLNFLKQFYKTQTDKYDFIILFPAEQLKTHLSILISAGDLQGTGGDKVFYLPPTYKNYTNKLKSIAEINFYTDWKDSFFNKKQINETFLQTLMHEIGHHWGCYISGWPGESQCIGYHWQSNLDLFYGDDRYIDILGYGQWIRNNGTDICVGQTDTTEWKFSKLTQYLMGLIPSSQVNPISIHESKENPTYYDCGKNKEINTYTMTIEDIIRVNGIKVPSYEDSQKDFNVAFVIIAPKGDIVEQGFIDYVNIYKQALPAAWEKATDQTSHVSAF
jgi:hypothetical protein